MDQIHTAAALVRVLNVASWDTVALFATALHS